MKKLLGAALLIACASCLAFAEGAAIAIQNEESSTLYFVVDPPELSGLSAGSPMAATRLAEYFSASSSEPRFTPLAPGAQTTISGLANGTHLLVVFFATQDPDTFPVRAVSVTADSAMGERFYAVYASPPLLEAPRGLGRLAEFPPSRFTAAAPQETPPQTAQAGPPAETAPQNAAPSEAPPQAAEATPPAQTPPAQTPPAAAVSSAPGSPTIASFSPSYQPVAFTREAKGEFAVQGIEQSRSWNLAGTRIMEIGGRIEGSKLTLSLSVAEGFSPDVSYFFYVFGARRAGAADDFTLEMRPRALPSRGVCLLWRPGAGPSMFGTVTVSGTTVTLEASLADVPQDLVPDVGPGATFDLTSCRFDQSSGVYEEFYFATVAMADITVFRR
ncbi:MAG TPA: hypothetical protein VMV03_07580 [Spirochaetia bacterium]|nr:hypothetical protein [Spirochaetia bacterium]